MPGVDQIRDDLVTIRVLWPPYLRLHGTGLAFAISMVLKKSIKMLILCLPGGWTGYSYIQAQLHEPQIAGRSVQIGPP
ncbi:MAG: hypothetical protein IPO69_20445 [Saprospiraceae bacterium]|nr:hypothetical protein [Saprospiraceae bacterium]